jgi:hypothetical protein
MPQFMARAPVLLLTFVILIPQIAAQSTNTTDAECRVPGDPDILGLGVRLGLYFQLLSTFLLALPRYEEARDAFIPTIFFFTGFMTAVLYSVATQSPPPGAVIACTWYPILFFVGFFCVNYTHDSEIHTGARSVWAFILWMATGVLNLWFWFHGVHLVNEKQCMEPRVFLFANLGALGGVRIVFAFIAVFFVSGPVGMFLYSWFFENPDKKAKKVVGDVEARSEVEMGQIARAERLDASSWVDVTPSASNPTLSDFQATDGTQNTSHDEKSEGEDPQQPLVESAPALEHTAEGTAETAEAHDLKMRTLYGSVTILTFYIIASELQLKWNHLDGINSVNTTGQIIPLTLGVMSLVRSIWLLKYSKPSAERTEDIAASQIS